MIDRELGPFTVAKSLFPHFLVLLVIIIAHVFCDEYDPNDPSHVNEEPINRFGVRSKLLWSCARQRAQLEEPYGFKFMSPIQYVDASIPAPDFKPNAAKGIPIKDYARTVEQRSIYSCNDETEALVKYTLQSPYPNRQVFNAHQFLSLIRNKTFVIVGDSLGMQLFSALETDLNPYATRGFNGNGTHRFFEYYPNGKPMMEEFPRVNAAFRWYDDYNATIFYCKDGLIEPLRYYNTARYCTDMSIRMAARGGILLIVAGAWYKPFFEFKGNYTESMRVQSTEWARILYTFRRYVAEHLKHATPKGEHVDAQVIWRLNSHTGPVDEYNLQFGTTGHKFDHMDGLFWDKHPVEAQWVSHYNALTRGIARLYGDYILDHYTISKEMIKFENEREEIAMNKSIFHPITDPKDFRPNEFRRTRLHADSLHYCAGGLFRAGNILLHKLIEHRQRCHKARVHSHSNSHSKSH